MSKEGTIGKRKRTDMAENYKPVIGISLDSNEDADFDGAPSDPVLWLKQKYADAVTQAGGVPVLLPPLLQKKDVELLLSRIDGLLLTGGYFDIDPSFYGENLAPWCGHLKPARTEAEFLLFEIGRKIRIPVLGICGGFQLINVAMGGTLYQDISVEKKGALKHEQKPVPSCKPSHVVTVEEISRLHSITSKKRLKVNSTHHQAIKKIGTGLVATAVADDGIIEAIEPAGKSSSFLLGVQWHPELLADSDETQHRIYEEFVKASSIYGAENKVS